MTYIESILYIITGIVLTKKPELIWKISCLSGNKNESPKTLTLAVISITGIIIFIFGLLPVARLIFKV